MFAFQELKKLKELSLVPLAKKLKPIALPLVFCRKGNGFNFYNFFKFYKFLSFKNPFIST